MGFQMHQVIANQLLHFRLFHQNDTGWSDRYMIFCLSHMMEKHGRYNYIHKIYEKYIGERSSMLIFIWRTAWEADPINMQNLWQHFWLDSIILFYWAQPTSRISSFDSAKRTSLARGRLFMPNTLLLEENNGPHTIFIYIINYSKVTTYDDSWTHTRIGSGHHH